MTIEQINQARLAPLMPELQVKANEMLGHLAQMGVGVLITQGLRTYAEQNALYAQGRTTKGKIVTKARGGQSLHNFGLAFDIVVLDALGKADWNVNHPGWAQAAQIGQQCGLEWGGAWKSFKDLPHYQLTGGHGISEIRQIFESRQGQAAFDAVWQLVRSSL